MQPVSVPTSFWVTVSMMVPKAGMVDILTELEARKQGLTIHAQMCQHFRHFLMNVPKGYLCYFVSAEAQVDTT